MSQPLGLSLGVPPPPEERERILQLAVIADDLGVDSLAYLELDRLIEAIDTPGAGFCTACVSGDYPIIPDVELAKGVLDAVRV